MNYRSSFFRTAAPTVALAFAAPAFAQHTAIVLYDGQNSKQTGVSIQRWGGGEMTETDEAVYAGTGSLKLVTHGMSQGGRLVLAKPADLKSAVNEQGVCLRLTYKLQERNANGGAGGPGFGPGGGKFGGAGGLGGPGFGGGKGGSSSGFGGPGGGAGFGGPGGGIGGRGGGIGGPGGGLGRGGGLGGPGGGPGRGGGLGGPGGGLGGGLGGPGGGGGATSVEYFATPKPLRNLRVVLVTSDGKQSSSIASVNDSVKNDQGWTALSIPLVGFSGLKNTSAQISEVLVFGDAPATLFVGDIRTVQDQTPITIDEMPERTVAVNDIETFVASAEAGSTPLKYEWTIGKAGVQPGPDGKYPVDAEGRTLKYQFRRSGDYEVVLTVSDAYGIKPPKVYKSKVTVTL